MRSDSLIQIDNCSAPSPRSAEAGIVAFLFITNSGIDIRVGRELARGVVGAYASINTLGVALSLVVHFPGVLFMPNSSDT